MCFEIRRTVFIPASLKSNSIRRFDLCPFSELHRALKFLKVARGAVGWKLTSCRRVFTDDHSRQAIYQGCEHLLDLAPRHSPFMTRPASSFAVEPVIQFNRLLGRFVLNCLFVWWILRIQLVGMLLFEICFICQFYVTGASSIEC